MHIDFAALGLVAVVTIVAALVIVTIVATAARLLQPVTGTASAGRRTGGWALLGLAGLIGLYGLYLIVPYFH